MSTRGYKLKDFSRLTNLSRKALLLYQKRGLIIPDQVDERTGYRYYSARQLRRAAVIAFMRNLDIPLNDIPKLLDGTASASSYFTDSGKRMELIRQQIKTAHALQAIQMIDQSERFLHDKIEMAVWPQVPVLSLEGRGELKEVSLYFSLIGRFMTQYGLRATAPSFAFYYRDSDRERIHFKCCCPVESLTTIHHSDIRCEMFPSTKVAFLRHFGDYGNLSLTYAALEEAIRQQGWKHNGDFIETYVLHGDRKYTDSASFLTIVAGVVE